MLQRVPARKRQSAWALYGVGIVAGIALAAMRRQQPQLAHARSGTPGSSGSEKPAFGEPKATDEPRWKQHARARERGRGREAVSPWQIPWTGWKDIFWRVYEEIQKDRVTAVAAGVVFFCLLAVFPALTAMVSSYGLFADVSTIGEHLTAIGGILPDTSLELVREQITRITSNSGEKLTFGFLFGFLFALWSANAGMKAIFDALNVIYDEEEKRSFIKLNLVSLMFTIGGIVAMLCAIAAVVVFPLILTFFGITSVNPVLLSILRWPILFCLIIFGLALIYRYGPSRREAEWRWVSPGSVFAALVWIIASLGFSYYLSNFADYNATYGSLGAVMGLMMWMWISSMVILTGAELNAEVEHQTAEDSTEGGEKPLGARGAAMADTVGEAKA